MANEVRVDFVLNPSQLDAAVNQTVAKSVQGAKAVESAFSNSVAAVQKQALNLNFSLRQISDNLGGGIQQAALRSQAAISGTLGRLKELNFLMSQTRDPVLLNRYEAEVAKLSGDLDRLQDKITRVAALRSGGGANNEGVSRGAAAGRLNLARQGADVFTQLGSGQSLSLIAIQQGPQILDAAYQSGFKLAGVMQSIAGFAAAYGAALGIAGAGAAVVYKITSDIAKAEADKLRLIELEAIAGNKIRLSRAEEAKALADSIALQERQVKFGDQLKNATADRLKELLKIAELNAASAIDENTRNAAKDEVLKIRAAQLAQPTQFDKFRQEYNQRQEFEKQLHEQEKKNAEAAAKERIEKIREVGRATEDFFRSSSQRLNADNPFFKILSDAEALERQIGKLDPAFRRLAQTQASVATANSLFDARINATLGVSDLRSQASQFRNGQRGESSDDLLRRLGLNPEQFRSFSDIQKQSLANQVAVRQAVSFGNIGGNINGVNGVDLALGAFRNAQQQQSNIETPEQRFDRINRELRATSPANDAQRAILDRRLTQFTDPFALRQDQRNEVANALDREAERRARAEIEGIRLQNETNAILRQINASISKQTGTSLEVAIKPSAGLDIGVTPTPISPNQSQVNDLYPTEGGSFFNGQ